MMNVIAIATEKPLDVILIGMLIIISGLILLFGGIGSAIEESKKLLPALPSNVEDIKDPLSLVSLHQKASQG